MASYFMAVANISQRRLALAAVSLGNGAAVGETAAFWRVDRIRWITGDQDTFLRLTPFAVD